MKNTLIAVACAAFISTGAIAKPVQKPAPQPHNNHSVHMINKHPAPRIHHHAPAPIVAHVRPTPPPPPVHHYHDSGAILLGDALIAFAILASNAM